jgi:Na+/melibiose symporter-like transporter
MLLMLMLPPLVAALTTDKDGSIGIHTMGWLVILLLPLATLLIVSLVGERAEQGNRSHRFGDMFGVLRIPILQRYLVVDLLASLAPGITGALFLFYFEAALGYGFVDAGLFLLVYFCVGLAAVPGWLWLSRRTSKHVALACSLVTFGVMQMSTIFLVSGNFVQTAIGIGIAGIPYAAPTLLLRAMLADLSDAETLRTGQERAGLFYAMTIAVNKLGYAVPVGMLFPLLAAIGFAADKGTSNSSAALQGLTLLFSLPPALLALAAAALVWRWPIDAAVQAKVAQSLAEKA